MSQLHPWVGPVAASVGAARRWGTAARPRWPSCRSARRTRYIVDSDARNCPASARRGTIWWGVRSQDAALCTVASSVARSAAVSALAGRWRGPCRWSASAPARQRSLLAPQLALALLAALRLGRRPGLRAGGLGVERLLRHLPPRGQVGQLEPFAAQQGTQRGLVQAGGLLHDPELLRAGPVRPSVRVVACRRRDGVRAPTASAWAAGPRPPPPPVR
jgi:hypothetical protein